MAKEIGNWGKLPEKHPKAKRARRSSSALELAAYRVELDEKILWASFGSGSRQDGRLPLAVLFSTTGSLILSVIINAFAATTTAAPQVASLTWLLTAIPIYVGYRIHMGPRLEIYAVTDQRALILQRNFPYLLKTCDILRLRVDEPKPPNTKGDVRFGKEQELPQSRDFIAWLRYMTPEPGFYGIENPLAVAKLISERVDPGVFPDRYAAVFEELPI